MLLLNCPDSYQNFKLQVLYICYTIPSGFAVFIPLHVVFLIVCKRIFGMFILAAPWTIARCLCISPLKKSPAENRHRHTNAGIVAKNEAHFEIASDTSVDN
jgi:hypothetical protein